MVGEVSTAAWITRKTVEELEKRYRVSVTFCGDKSHKTSIIEGRVVRKER
jgi:general stress protein 26